MITQFKYYDHQTEDMCNDYSINDFSMITQLRNCSRITQ